MSNIDKRNRGEKTLDEWIDTGVKAATDWGNDYIRKGVPKAMDWVSNKFREIILTLGDIDKPEDRKDRIKTAFQEIFEYGAEHKEWEMVEAMKKVGFSREQIQQVLEQVEESNLKL